MRKNSVCFQKKMREMNQQDEPESPRRQSRAKARSRDVSQAVPSTRGRKLEIQNNLKLQTKMAAQHRKSMATNGEIRSQEKRPAPPLFPWKHLSAPLGAEGLVCVCFFPYAPFLKSHARATTCIMLAHSVAGLGEKNLQPACDCTKTGSISAGHRAKKFNFETFHGAQSAHAWAIFVA